MKTDVPMSRESKKWKDASQQGSRGIHLYLGKGDLSPLDTDGVLDLDADIEYSVSVGSSDGRARAFVQLRNKECDICSGYGRMGETDVRVEGTGEVRTGEVCERCDSLIDLYAAGKDVDWDAVLSAGEDNSDVLLPDTEDMSVPELRAEAQQLQDELDFFGLAASQKPAWDRHEEVAAALRARTDVEFPECPEDDCDSTCWLFTAGDPPTCEGCGHEVSDAEVERAIHDASERLVHSPGGDELCHVECPDCSRDIPVDAEVDADVIQCPYCGETGVGI